MRISFDFKRKRTESGFTLIELLIVIAIILILIAIALPNFLEAQIRAKTAKAYGEMRSLGIAIESLRTERGVLLIDFWDDHSNEAFIRIRDVFGGAGSWVPRCSAGHPDGRSMECVYYPLTTPVAYIKEIPQDALAPDVGQSGGNTGHDEWIGHPGNRTYLYADRESNPPKVIHFFQPYDFNQDQFPLVPVPGYLDPIRVDEFIVCGFGPGRENNLYGNSVRKPFVYSPTNGSKSVGSLYFRSSAGIAR